MSFKATSGKYVVNNKDIWVYDVDIYFDKENSTEKKAVVGFSRRQTNGALFWQCDMTEVIKEKYESNRKTILKLAREFRDLHRPRAVCE